MTDPYTPTTEEVREDYAFCNWRALGNGDGFDRWLVQHEAKVRAEVIDYMEGQAPYRLADAIFEARLHFALPIPSTGTTLPNAQKDGTYEVVYEGATGTEGVQANDGKLEPRAEDSSSLVAVPEPTGDPQ